MVIAVYPGSFDPLTNGHLDIITRAAKLFDKLYVLVAINEEKKYAFSIDERVALIEMATKHLNNVEVAKTTGLTVDFCNSIKAKIMVRGIRDEADLSAEKHLYNQNKNLNPNIETLYINANPKYNDVSSTLIKNKIQNIQDITGLVPEEIKDIIIKKLGI